MLVPKEMKVEYSRGVEALSDEQLEQAIEAVTKLEARADEDNFKLGPCSLQKSANP